MNKYLKKLKGSYSPNTKDTTLNVKFNFTNMACGNGYKYGTKHEFFSQDPEDIKLLTKLIPKFRLGVKITDVTENSFVFESPNKDIQIFFFRICRYTRAKNIRKILENTLIIHKKGVKIQNAFALAHAYTWKSYSDYGYFNPNMDGFSDIARMRSNTEPYFKHLNKIYKTLKEFKEVFYKPNMMSYTSIFRNVQIPDAKLRITYLELLKEKKFKEAEKYLLTVLK